MDLIAEGIKQELIRFEDEAKYVVYVHQDKRRNFSNPEEAVQVETFLNLVLTYKYPVKRIRLCVPYKWAWTRRKQTSLSIPTMNRRLPSSSSAKRNPSANWNSFVLPIKLSATRWPKVLGTYGSPANSKTSILRYRQKSRRHASQFLTCHSVALQS